MGAYPFMDPGLQALVIDPQAASDADTWKGPYLDSQTSEIQSDPWGHRYVYFYPGDRSRGGYDLSCAGPDGQPGTADDIFR
jgi:general secretion pathway protein G